MTAIAQALSAALLHFIWQGTAVAFLLWIALQTLSSRSANVRYIASCAALALMATMPIVTAWMLYTQPNPAAVSVAAMPAFPTVATRVALQSTTLAWGALWRQWALPVWSIGVLLFSLRLVVGCRHVAALRRLGHAVDGQIAATVSLLARRMKATGAIRVLVSTATESPSVVGWLRPAILLPAATLAGLEPEQLRAVLAHEIAHIRRHDYLVNLVQTLVEALLFYHPAVWWVSARIRHERELCCDDAAVAVCGDALSYARALTSLERLRATTPRLALGSTGGSLLYRIQRLAGVRQEIGTSKLPGIAALALGLACFGATVHWAKAQQMMQQPQLAGEWGIAVSTTGELLHRNRVPYPEATDRNGIQGTVMLEATLDQTGNVADAHVLSGPPELRKTALQSVLQWQFANTWAGETQQVKITFQRDALSHTGVDGALIKDEPRAPQEIHEKPRQAHEIDRGSTDAVARTEEVQQTKTQRALLKLDLLRLQMAEEKARMSLSEGNPNLAALVTQIDALKEQLAILKQANYGRAVYDDDANQTERLLETQYVELRQQLADARKSLSEKNPQIVMLKAQLEALAEKTQASLAGSPLGRIEIFGLPDAAKAELVSRLNLRLGEILSADSIESAAAEVRSFDGRLECRFFRAANGDVVLRIAAPGAIGNPGK